MQATFNSTFGFKDRVRITASGETGTVVAASFYDFGGEAQFYVRYVAADGRACNGWFGLSELEDVIDGPNS